MKRVNLYLISAALLTGFLTSCNDMENFDNNVFVDNTIKVNSIFLKGSNDSEQRSFKVAIAKQESEDVTIHIAADPSLVSTYNEGYYDQTIALQQTVIKYRNRRLSFLQVLSNPVKLQLFLRIYYR